jgi:hypothetical protein
MDLIAGNLGLNSILKASVKEPVEMYLSDFDNNGSLDQVICSYENGVSYPVASLDDLSGQISGLKKKFPDYAGFGGKTISDIFGKNAVDNSVVKKAVLLSSCIFRNNGDGTFKTEMLPIQAQFSPVRDIMVLDLNHDGQKDLIVAGNDYQVKPSFGRYDASYCWCMLSDTAGGYRTLMPLESGFKIIGDSRKMIILDVGGKQYIVVAVNDGNLRIFRLIQ